MHKNAKLIKKYKETSIKVSDENLDDNWDKFEERIKLNPSNKEMNKDIILKELIEQKNINIMKPRNIHDINKLMQNKY